MCESVKVPGWQSGQMRWPRESLSLLGRSGSNPDPGVNPKVSAPERVVISQISHIKIQTVIVSPI